MNNDEATFRDALGTIYPLNFVSFYIFLYEYG
jgi:hypothetical protein